MRPSSQAALRILAVRPSVRLPRTCSWLENESVEKLKLCVNVHQGSSNRFVPIVSWTHQRSELCRQLQADDRIICRDMFLVLQTGRCRWALRAASCPGCNVVRPLGTGRRCCRSHARESRASTCRWSRTDSAGSLSGRRTTATTAQRYVVYITKSNSARGIIILWNNETKKN